MSVRTTTVSTVVDGTGVASLSAPSCQGNNRAFRLIPFDGPSYYPRVVQFDDGELMTVCDSAWIKRTFQYLQILPDAYLKVTSGTKLGWMDPEQWTVITTDDPEDCFSAAGAPTASKGQNLIALQTLKPANLNPGILPPIDFSIWDWAQYFVGGDAGDPTTLDMKLGYATNQNAPNPGTDTATVGSMAAGGWMTFEMNRKSVIGNTLNPVRLGATNYYAQGPAPSMAVVELANMVGFGGVKNLYIVLRAGRAA